MQTCIAGTRTFTYNAANQLVSVAYPDSRIIAYEYDANGNRSKITYPSGTMVEYTYDTRNQPLTVKVTKGADDLPLKKWTQRRGNGWP